MVRPFSSKRKLFIASREQKENEPAELGHPVSSRLEPRLPTHSQKQSPTQENILVEKADISSNDKKSGAGDITIKDKNSTFEDVCIPCAPGRPVMPMSERQQIAFLMQMSSPSSPAPQEYAIKSPTTPNTPQICRGVLKRNERGETLLHVAAIKGDDEKVQQLIDQSFNVNATDYAGWTALHEACNRGFVNIASLLIQAGADVNAKGLDNETPLHDACINNHHQIVKLLLRSGASTDAINRRGKSPRDICRSAKILSLIEKVDAGLFLDNNLETGYAQFEGFTRESFLANPTIILSKLPPSQIAQAQMSRRTPPANKTEDKVAQVSGTLSSNGGGSVNSDGGNGAHPGGNGGPESPRVTLRLPQMPRTPDKAPSQRLHETKGNPESEDVYEFRCSKEEAREDNSDEKSENPKQESVTHDPKIEKRSREGELEDDEKRKRRKDEVVEKPGKGNSRSNGLNQKQLTSTTGCSSTVTSAVLDSTPVSTPTTIAVPTSTTTDYKSPSSSCANSPKPSSTTKSPDAIGSDNEELKSDAIAGAPKVPPLKIVLAPTATSSEQETSLQTGKNGSGRLLPYVVSSSASDEKETMAAEAKEATSPKQEEVSSTISSTTNTPMTTLGTTSTTMTTCIMGSNSNGSGTVSCTSTCSINSMCGTEKGGIRITRSQRGGTSGTSMEEPIQIKMEPQEELPVNTTIDTVPPRKRKLKKVPDIPDSPSLCLPDQPLVANCYEMFLRIRKQVERRRKLLVPVQPKPPQGFKDYLMNRCSYALAGNSNDQQTVPLAPPPAALNAQPLIELFTEQEAERHKLRLQHQIEREKLVLSVEQEILRVHGRAARALANQVLPFSVCTILKDEEVYNIITPEQEEKDRNARSRYNGRLFISWLQDVDDKWEKIKEAMVLRHHNEAESLHAVQKMGWEWKMKEINQIDANARPNIDELHVPMVPVSDFDLLPDINS